MFSQCSKRRDEKTIFGVYDTTCFEIPKRVIYQSTRGNGKYNFQKRSFNFYAIFFFLLKCSPRISPNLNFFNLPEQNLLTTRARSLDHRIFRSRFDVRGTGACDLWRRCYPHHHLSSPSPLSPPPLELPRFITPSPSHRSLNSLDQYIASRQYFTNLSIISI